MQIHEALWVSVSYSGTLVYKPLAWKIRTWDWLPVVEKNIELFNFIFNFTSKIWYRVHKGSTLHKNKGRIISYLVNEDMSKR